MEYKNNLIRESIKSLLNVKKEEKFVDDFARYLYNEKFKDVKKQDGTWHYYSGYKLISENKIVVNYDYGAGDMEFNGDFTVEI